MSTTSSVTIWDPMVRLCHWGMASCFVINYFIVHAGSLIHEIAGYAAASLVAMRMIWGMTRSASSFASFKHFSLSREAIVEHCHHLKVRRVPHNSGHNPFGWLMITLVFLLFSALAVTGFMMEEIDALFGNSTLDFIHGLLADILYVAVIVHVVAIITVQWWGNIPLIGPMINGKRKN